MRDNAAGKEKQQGRPQGDSMNRRPSRKCYIEDEVAMATVPGGPTFLKPLKTYEPSDFNGTCLIADGAYFAPRYIPCILAAALFRGGLACATLLPLMPTN